MGIIHTARGNLTEAEYEYRKAITLNPYYLYARYELGKILEKLGRSDEAINQYREIIRLASQASDPPAFIYERDEEKVKKIVEDARQRLAHNKNESQIIGIGL